MLDGPHPPEVVTLLTQEMRDRHRDGTETPDTRSTLSSTPNSPRSPSRTGRELVAAVSLALEDPKENRRKSDVPFDEGGKKAAAMLPPQVVSIGPDDEKKMEEGDELMGPNKEARHRSSPSTPTQKQGTGYAGSNFVPALADDETMSQPPSLSESRTWTAGEAEPGAILTRAGSNESGKDDCPDDEPLLSQSSSSLLNRLQSESPSARLKDMLRTPVQDLESPPKFVKSSMNKPWSTPEDAEEAPLDEIRDIENTNALRFMVSPDGKLEFRSQNSKSPRRSGENSILNHDTNEESSFDDLSNVKTTDGALTGLAVSLGGVVGMATSGAVALMGDLVLMNNCGGERGSDDESGGEAVSSPIYSVASTSRYEPNSKSSWVTGDDEDTLSPSAPALGGVEPTKPRIYDAPPGPALTGLAEHSKPKVYDAPPGPSLTGTTSNGDYRKYLKPSSGGEQSSGHRELTPKKDFQTSENSAAWLKEEFRRRSTIKEEINAAILSAHDQGSLIAPVEDETPMDEMMDTRNQIGGFPESLSLNKSGLDVSLQSEDDEVAAITTTNQERAAANEALISKYAKYAKLTASQSDDGAPKPRRLEYGDEPEEASEPGRIPSASPATHTQYHQHRVLASPYGNPRPPKEGRSLQQEMQRFASNTRAALREKEQSAMKEPDSPFRSLATTSSNGESEPSSQPLKKAGGFPAPTTVPRGTATVGSEASGRIDISTTPALVQSMDSPLGIAIGDITLSLLNENTGRTDTPRNATWANRVHSAIWRCRRMRREMGAFPSLPVDARAGSPSLGRTSLPPDMNKARVADGVRSIESTQEAALNHLKHDEIEQALELFQGIIFAYYAYFERSLKEREANPGSAGVAGTTDFRPYIGVALHNLGILNLLNGQYQEAVSYFTRSIDNRIACLGEGHPDHVASLVKLATCHYALNEFAEAHAKFEQALIFARRSARSLEDRVQMAEILNNLGCLAYMCGQPGAANGFFRESLDVQFSVLSHSMYIDTALVAQSITLSISITRANIGFVKLVTKDLPVAITALENALMEQQILLRGANDTAIATMDHLAVANLLHGDQNKAAMMFGRILTLQQREYGPHDRRCFLTVDKINMVRSRGTNFERAIEELRKTFTLPDISRPLQGQMSPKSKETPPLPHSHQLPGSTKSQKNKVMKVLKSIRKKKP